MRGWKVALSLVFLIGAAMGAGSLAQVGYAAPTGVDAIGRTTLRWIDETRTEPMTTDPSDRREVVAHVWYPTVASGAERARYFPDLGVLRDAMADTGEVGLVELFGLGFVGTHAAADTPVDGTDLPILLFSPGNATNSVLYSGLLEELASHGYVVVGVEHPYDVLGVTTADGEASVFAADRWPQELEQNLAFYLERVDERAADLAFVVDRLLELDEGDGMFGGLLDTDRIGAIGHSLGAITAGHLCQTDDRVLACLNLDGLYNAAPWDPRFDPPEAGDFMFMTRIDDPIDTGGAIRAVVSGIEHDAFGDTPTLGPALPLPGEATADRTMRIVREYAVAFFDRTLRGSATTVLDRPSPYPEVTVHPATG
jgi:hypothetical protein